MKYIEIFVKSALSKSKLQNTHYALNPYKGCEHRCIYCYAPYVLHTPIEEWNSVVYVKRNLPTILQREIKRRKGRHIEIGTVTDAYQPAEKRYEITRMSLDVLKKYQTKVSLLTKSSLVLRDFDLLTKMQAEIGVTITTFDEKIRRKMEPYASPVDERLKVLHEFSGKTRTYAFIGPIFPHILMSHLEEMLKEIKHAGVSYVIFDRFRVKNGMQVPDFLQTANVNWKNVKRKINKLAKKFDLPYYFGW